MRKGLSFAALAAVFFAGCHAGGTNALPPAGSFERLEAAPSAKGSSVAFSIVIPKGAYNPQGLAGTAYAVWDGNGPLVARFAADLSTQNKACKTNAGGRTCSFAAAIPAGGPYEIDLLLYNVRPTRGTFPTGQVIGGAKLAHAVGGAAGASVIALTASPQLASVSIALQPGSIHSLAPAKIAAIVTGYDKTDAAIVSNAFLSGKKGQPVYVTADPGTQALFTIAGSPVTKPINGLVSIQYASSKASATQIASGFKATLRATLGAPPAAAAVLSTATLTALKPAFKFHTLPGNNPFPQSIAAGADGTIWYSDFNIGVVGHVTTDLVPIKQYGGFAHAQGFVLDGNGALWMANNDGNSSLAKIPNGGTPVFYHLPVNTYPAGVSVGKNGVLWWASTFNNFLNTVTPNGTFGPQYPLPQPSSVPYYSAMGADGNQYFILNGVSQIARITTAGVIKRFAVPGTGHDLENIIAASDGKLYFVDYGLSTIYGWKPSSPVFAKYKAATQDAPIGPLAQGPDGKIWYVSTYGYVVRLDPAAHTFTRFGTNDNLAGIALGPDGGLYVTSVSPAGIGKLL